MSITRLIHNIPVLSAHNVTQGDESISFNKAGKKLSKQINSQGDIDWNPMTVWKTGHSM